MRQAVVDALLADPGVVALVGSRVYIGRGPFGGISRELTPEAFDEGPSGGGDLRPSIVVRMGPRTAIQGRPLGPDGLPGVQLVDVWVYAQHDYVAIFEVVRAVKRVLGMNRTLRPVEDPVAWAETRWESEPFGEQLDDSMTPPVPVVLSRYAATARELLT